LDIPTRYHVGEDIRDEWELEILEDIEEANDILRHAHIDEKEVIQETREIDGVYDNIEIAQQGNQPKG